MTKFINKVNAFGNNAGDSLTNNPTTWKGVKTGVPKGKLKGVGETGDISGSNRRLAKAKYGTGGSNPPFKGTNAFSKGRKG
jgi:hypothetical protein